MVVEYRAGSEGNVLNFFVVTPRIIFQYRGSIIPSLLPQIVLSQLLSVWANYLNDQGTNPFDGKIDKGFNVLGILLSFLLVFKTQSANAQFWAALGYVDGLQQSLRTIAMISCGVFDWKKSDDIKPCCKKIVRCLVLYYYVMIENFQRTGSNQTTSVEVQDALRGDIRALTGDKEFAMLFPNEDVNKSGSSSIYNAANPSIVLFWITLVVGNVIKEQAVPPPIAGVVLGHIHSLGTAFYGMERIDKTQFALPYAQIVKLLTLVFMGCLPFIIVKQSGNATYFISLLATIGFFGLDQVAEILESPFGKDANDIQLRDYGESLMQDIECMYRARDMELDTVITGDDDISFHEILNKRSPEGLVRSKASLSRKSFFEGTMATHSKSLTSVRPCED